MAVQMNPGQQAGVFNVCSSDLLKRGPQKPPQDLGLQPIQRYNYLNQGNIEPQDLATVAKNIQEAQQNPNMYYFTDDNPFIVEYCPGEQYIWKAVNECYDFDIFMLGSYLIDQHNQSVHLNAGSHGDPSGIMVSDLFAFEGPRIAGLAHSQHPFPWDNLKNISGKSTLNPVSTGSKPDYPPRANHVIYVWCFSFSTYFTSQQRYLAPMDNCGNSIPSMYKCTASQKPLTVPFYHPECSSIKGQRHYYDIETIIRLITQNSERLENRWRKPTRLTALATVLAKTKKAYANCFKSPSERLFEGLFNQKGEDYRYKIYCRLEGCTNVIDIREFKRDTSFETSLSRYKETVAKANREMISLVQLNSEKDREIARIQGESQNKTHRITFLESELGTKDQTIVGLNQENTTLKGRVTILTEDNEVLTNERNFVQKEKVQSDLVIEKQRDVIDQLEQGIVPEDLQEVNEMADQILLLPQINISRDLILKMPIRENYPNEWWISRMRMEKSCVENLFLQSFFHGGIISRFNSFVSNDFDAYERNHQEIVNAFLEHRRKKVLSKLSKEWVSFNKKYEIAQWNSFVLPFAEELMDRGIILERFNAITKEHNVSIKYKGPEKWKELEPSRWCAKTYKESISNLICQVARFEVADQIINVVKDLLNTEKQKEIARKIERERQEYWKKNPDVGDTDLWGGSGGMCGAGMR